MEARRAGTLLRPLAESPSAIPALLAIGVFVVLGASEGGFLPTAWYPAALFLAALLGVALVAIPVPGRVPAAVRIAVALLVAFTVWSYLSVLWADDQGAALDGANRSLIYALVFTLFAWWPMRAEAGATVLGAFGLAVAALGLFILLRASAAGDVDAYFIGGRFVDPVGYPNGNVALWFSGALPCVFLAARREVPFVLRGLGLGGAALLTGLALLGQSRGWLFTLPVVLLLFLAVVPGRARNAVALVAIAAASLVALGPIFDVLDGIRADAAAEPLLDRATRAILLGAGALALLGALVGFLDRRVTVSTIAARRTSAAVLAALVLAAAGGVAAVWVAHGSPLERAAQAWEDFKSNERPTADRSRFSSALGQNRYDFWRVGLDQFTADPLTGAGADNFQQDYLLRGRSTERPRYPHSLEVRVLSQTGIVGALLLLAAFACAVVAASADGAIGTRARRRYFRRRARDLPLLGRAWVGRLVLGAARAWRPGVRHARARDRGRQAIRHGERGPALAPRRARRGRGDPGGRPGGAALARVPTDRARPGRLANEPAGRDRAARLGRRTASAVEPAGRRGRRYRRPARTPPSGSGALRESPRAKPAKRVRDASARGPRVAAGHAPTRRVSSVDRAAALNPRDAIIRATLDALEAGETLDAGRISTDATERARGLAGRD